MAVEAVGALPPNLLTWEIMLRLGSKCERDITDKDSKGSAEESKDPANVGTESPPGAEPEDPAEKGKGTDISSHVQPDDPADVNINPSLRAKPEEPADDDADDSKTKATK